MILSAEEEKGGGKRTIPTVRNLQRKSRIVRVFLGSSKGQQGDRRHDDGGGRHSDGKGQQGDRRHDDGDGRYDNERHDDGKGQQGDRRHDDGDGWHDDGDWRHDDRRHDDGKGQKEAAPPPPPPAYQPQHHRENVYKSRHLDLFKLIYSI